MRKTLPPLLPATPKPQSNARKEEFRLDDIARKVLQVACEACRVKKQRVCFASLQTITSNFLM